MSEIYFISDTHFSHANIIKFCNRPFKDITEMNETIIKNWNRVVGKNDIVFFLGDFHLGKNKDGEEEALVRRLNGRKKLLMGNHDKGKAEYYLSIGFEEVFTYPIVYKKFFILSHKPIAETDGTGFLNIHGHIHNNGYREIEEANLDNYFNVSVEVINYTPIKFKTIKKLRGFD